MGFIVAVSAFIIPLIIFYVVVDGIIHQTDVYDVFVEGAKDGMKTVVSILAGHPVSLRGFPQRSEY